MDNSKTEECTTKGENVEVIYQKSPDGGKTPKETAREITLEEKEKIEQKVILAYKNLEAYLKSDQYDQELRNELEKSNPNYLDVLRKWRNDLENSDHGIVIAGETSAGKSTLINKMLGKMLFKGRNNESTSTICKLRNSERIRIVTTTMTGKTEETDFTGKCDLETKEGVRILRNFLKELTDMVSSTNSVTYRSVEIELPFSFLKCNTLLVDTPGIGGSGEVTKKLIDYLPNALIFIFVINVASAGGMQHDRLPEIMKSILLCQLDHSMPCFNPENVIFITNKWDTIVHDEEDSSDEDEETKTWNTLRDNIKRRWPSVKEEFIFKMNLREVSPGKKNFSTEQFDEFKTVLETMVTNAENNRVMQHLRFLQEMLNNISKGLHARIELGKKTEEEQKLLVERQQKKIDMLTEECKQARKSFLEKNNKAKEDIAQECYKYMSTDAGKEKILNPPGRTPLSKVDWNKTDFEKEIEERVDAYVESYLQSDGVMERYKDIQIEVNLFHDKVNEILVEMESEWIETRQVIHGFDPGNFLIAFGLLTSPLWFAALAIGFGVAAAVVAGVSFVLGALFGWNRKTDIEIYTEYNRYKATIRKKICKHLDENCGLIIVKLVDKVTDDVLPKRIQAFETMIRQISESRAKVLANQEVLKNLAMQINAMEETVTGLIKSLKT